MSQQLANKDRPEGAPVAEIQVRGGRATGSVLDPTRHQERLASSIGTTNEQFQKLREELGRTDKIVPPSVLAMLKQQELIKFSPKPPTGPSSEVNQELSPQQRQVQENISLMQSLVEGTIDLASRRVKDSYTPLFLLPEEIDRYRPNFPSPTKMVSGEQVQEILFQTVRFVLYVTTGLINALKEQGLGQDSHDSLEQVADFVDRARIFLGAVSEQQLYGAEREITDKLKVSAGEQKLVFDKSGLDQQLKMAEIKLRALAQNIAPITLTN